MRLYIALIIQLELVTYCFRLVTVIFAMFINVHAPHIEFLFNQKVIRKIVNDRVQKASFQLSLRVCSTLFKKMGYNNTVLLL